MFLYIYEITTSLPISLLGDNGQLQPFTVSARKMHLMPSIFDLDIS